MPQTNDTPPRTRSSRGQPVAIPRFALYGETAAPGQDMLHIESVASRSRLYHWEIEPHVHQGLYQILWLQRGSAEVVLDDTLLDQLSKGQTAIFVVFKTPEEGIGIPVSLNGFADGFAQLP